MNKVKKLNKRGFTLVELLATMVILGILMAVAVPNVVGVLTTNRNKTYVADAKKLVTQAEYKLRSSTSVVKPEKNHCVIMALNYLDNNEFENPPYGGEYNKYQSYVIIKKTTSGSYDYYVQLDEDISAKATKEGNEGKKKEDYSGVADRGIDLVKKEDLYNKQASELVVNITGKYKIKYKDDYSGIDTNGYPNAIRSLVGCSQNEIDKVYVINDGRS